jgi:microcystin-dependent protein
MADQAYRQKGMKSLAVIVSMVILASGSGILIGLRDARAETEIEKIYDRLNKLEKLTQDAMKASIPIGTILPYGGKVEEKRPGEPIEVQEGWFFCNGAVLSREKYQDLYRVIEAAFGAPTGETFNLPDLRGRFARGVDHGAGRDPDALSRPAAAPGGKAGDEVGSVQEDALQGHRHSTNAINPDSTKSTSMRGASWRMPDKHAAIVGSVINDDPYGQARVAKETRPKNVYVNWIIKVR